MKQVELERKYWRDVLQRAVEVIKFLAERGLPFRGDDEVFRSANNDNYMGVIELIAKFDPFYVSIYRDTVALVGCCI